MRNAFHDIVVSYSVLGKDLVNLSVTVRCSILIYYPESLSMLMV